MRSVRFLLSTCALAAALLAAPWLAAQGGDTDPPVIAITEGGVPLADGSLFAAAVTPVVTVTDASPTTVDIQLDGSPFTSGTAVSEEGSHLLTVTATDDATNQATAQVSFTIDLTPPLFVSVAPATGTVTADADVTLSGEVSGADSLTVDGAAVTLAGGTFSAGPYALSEGERTFNLVATDAAGNAAARSHLVVRDSAPPTVALTQPAAGALVGEAALSVLGTAGDPHLTGVTVNGVAATLSGGSFVASQVPLAEGPNTLAAVATDAAGNNAQDSRGVTLDSLVPSLAISDPAPGSVVPDAAIAVSGTVADPHLDRVEVAGGSGTVAAAVAGGSWSATVALAEGANTLSVTAVDQLGHSAQASVEVVRDSTAPEVRITAPAEGSVLSAETVTVSGTVEQETGISVTVNGLAATVTGGSFSVADVPLVEGENRLIARVTDALGNQGAHTRYVHRDTVAPVFVSVEPAAGALALPVETRFVVTFSEELAAPAAGALTLETAAGAPLAATLVQSGGAGAEGVVTVIPTAPLPSATDLRLDLTAALVDLGGNPLADPQTLSFTTADVAAPAAPALSPAPPSHLCAPSLTLAGSAEAAAVVEVTGAAAGAQVRAASDGSWSLQVSLAPERLNRLAVTAVDAAGNRSPATYAEVVADCTAPAVLRADRGTGDSFTVTFSETVDPATVTAATVTLDDATGAPVAGSVGLDPTGRVATFAPSSAPPAGALTLAVAPSVADLAANPLAYPFNKVFTDSSAGSGFLAGRVLDAATGRPLAGAQVVVVATDGVPSADPAPQQVTGAAGRFQLPVPAGVHDLTVGRPGYTPVFRVVSSAAGEGADVFDPRLSPAAPSATVDSAGGSVAGSALPGAAAGTVPAVTVPAGALAAATPVSLSALEEQALPARLPYGWSPRAAAWLDLDGAPLSAAATIELAVDAADGAQLTFVELDLATLQWRVVDQVTVADGRVSAAAAGEGGYAAVSADSGATAPPAPVVGQVLAGSAGPAGSAVTAAQLDFDPAQVLPSQRSQATVTYTLGGDAPSGLPLTLAIREELELLDGTVRREAPFEADLSLYRDAAGSPRSRFGLVPSEVAQLLPISLGFEDVTVRDYEGQQVSGNVVGATGGSVVNDDGDRIDLPPGALASPTAVTLERRPAADLPLDLPGELELIGLLELALGGETLAQPAAISWSETPAPAAGERGLLLAAVDLGDSGSGGSSGGGLVYRVLAELTATAGGWTTAAIDPADLAWPGARQGGTLVLARRLVDLAFLRGTVLAVGASPAAGALVSADTAPWVQLTGADGAYALPAPLGAVTVVGRDLITGDEGAASGTLTVADERLDLDLQLLPTGPQVLTVTPADGAVNVPAGIEPTVLLSEPLALSTLASGVRLLRLDGTGGTTDVPITVQHQGNLVTVLPQATLLPGVSYELRLTTALTDLAGNPMSQPVDATFTVREGVAGSGVDPARIFLVEPDGGGTARVVGNVGAVPAGTLVFAENITSFAATSSVNAAPDGSFDLPIAAGFDDELLLHVLIEGGNEVVLRLGPFFTADQRAARVGAAGAELTTVDGFSVRVEEGTFEAPTWVRVEPAPLVDPTLPSPDGFTAVAAFELDFGGAEAVKRVEVTLPAPGGLSDDVFLLSHRVEVLGEPAWMMVDLASLVDGRLTTDALAVAAAGVVPRSYRVQPAEGVLGSYGEVGARSESVSGAPRPIGAAAGLTERGGFGQGVEKAGPVPTHKLYTPGASFPGQYQIHHSQEPFGLVSVPLAWSFDHSVAAGINFMVASVNDRVRELLARDALWIPALLGEPFTLEVRDLLTGYLLFAGDFDPPPGDGAVLTLPPDELGDQLPPLPVAGTPLRFFTLAPSAPGSDELAPGIDVAFSQPDPLQPEGTLTVSGSAGAVSSQADVRLLGLDDAVAGSASAGSDGAFTLGPLDIEAGKRYLLALGARIGDDEPLVISFSEALPEPVVGLEVRDSGNRLLSPTIEGVGTTEVLRITPETGWRAGETYTFRLLPSFADVAGNAWGENLQLPFTVRGSQVNGTQGLAAVRDVVALGGYLFVAAGSDGIAVFDARDPAALVNALPGGETFRWPLDSQVQGLALDPHGRLLAVGGGVEGPGLLRVYDPLALLGELAAGVSDFATLEAAFFTGSTVIADQLLNDGGTELPEGTPRRVSVLSSDDRVELWSGEALPAGVTVSPVSRPDDPAQETVTVSATGAAGAAPAGQPVTLRDLTSGRLVRVDAAVDGSFSLSLDVYRNDRVELLVHRGATAYVAITGVGLASVDSDGTYREVEDDPTLSKVLSYYTGEGDNRVVLCNEPVGYFGDSLLDAAPLFDPAAPAHPFTLVTLVGFKGLMLVEIDPLDLTSMSFLSHACSEVDGSRFASGLAVAQRYPVDLDGDGRLEAGEERDYAVIGHEVGGVLVYDVTDRERPTLVGRIPLPGSAGEITIDRQLRRLYVTGRSEGLWIVDFDSPAGVGLTDLDGDGTDDRILETVALTGTTNSPLAVLGDLGVLFGGGVDGGLSSVTVRQPRVWAVVPDEEEGGYDQIEITAPHGGEADGELATEAAFRLMAALPGSLGPEITLDLVSLGPGGAPAAGAAADGALGIDELPPAALTGTDGITLRRLSDNPADEGFHRYLSTREVALLADLKASRHYPRTQAEEDACIRCAEALTDAGGSPLPDERQPIELLSGDSVAVRFPPQLVTQLASLYGAERLASAELELAAMRWETAPAVRQEPARSPSLGAGDAAPGTLLHSGEMTHTATDLAVAGRGIDFAFTRTYRSGTVGAGPLGPGWDHSYRLRLREHPSGTVELFDGRGRVERFGEPSEEGEPYEAPAGWFVELKRSAAGWVLIDPGHGVARFDRFGRLVSLADGAKESAETGNELRFRYDAHSRLVAVVDTLEREFRLEYDADGRLVALRDFSGREVTYAYDAEGRLATVTSPAVTIGEATYPSGVTTAYDYAALPAGGDLAATLAARDNLTGVTDARGEEWLTVSYTDADGDGRSEEATGQTLGGDALSIAYDFGSRETTVTDRRGKLWIHSHDAEGHPTALTDPTGASWSFTYDAEGLPTEQTEPLGRITRWTYDTSSETGSGSRRSRGNLTELKVIADSRGPNGSAAELVTAYSAYHARSNQPGQITDPRGTVTIIERNAVGLPVEIIAAIGQPEEARTQLEYNRFGQPTRVTDPVGDITEYRYHQEGDSEGYLESVLVDPGGLGLLTRYGTDVRGNVTAMIDSRGVHHTSIYNELDWMVEETAAASASVDGAPALGYVTTYLHDELSQVVEMRIPAGVSGGAFTTEKAVYGPLSELLETRREVASGLEAVTTYLYDENRNLVRVTAPENRVTEITYDPRNLPLTTTRAAGTPEQTTESVAYNALGEPTTQTDPRGHDWVSAFDGFGRLARATDPLGHYRETVYDPLGLPAAVSAYDAGDTLLAKTEQLYDRLGRPTETRKHLWEGTASGSATVLTESVTYLPDGQVATVTDAEGRTTSFEHDAADRLVKTTDAAGNVTTLTLNKAGQPITTSTVEVGPDAGTITETATYDALGRPASVTDGEGNTKTFAHDARSRRVRMTDPEQHVTTWQYDGLNRQTEELRPEGIRVTTGWNLAGRRTTYTDAAGNTTTWQYDALDRTTGVTYPDSTSHSYGYDPSGNRTTLTDANGTVVTQTFDDANRRTAVAVTPAAGLVGPTAESYAWDGLHRLTTATSGSGPAAVTTAQTYDSLSRLLSETTLGKTVTKSYDSVGNATQLTYPSGQTVAQQHDPLNRLATVGNPATPTASFGYRGPYLRATTSYANGITGSKTFDAARRPLTTSQLGPGAGLPVFEERMSWSPLGLRASQARSDLAGAGHAMAYDGAGRLQAMARVPSSAAPAHNTPASASALAAMPERFSFQYDAAQNLTARTTVEGGVEETTALPVDPSGRNRPSAIDGIPLSYDANGNLTAKGDLRLQYDFRNRLSRVTTASGTEIATYRYDAFNRRVEKNLAGGETLQTAWSGLRELEDYADGQLTARRTFGSGLDEIVRLDSDLDGNGTLEQSYVPLYDATGNLVVATDLTGKPVERYAYSPYGERTIRVDLTPPAVEQVRVVADEIWLEISEAVRGDYLAKALADEDLYLVDTSTSTTYPLTVAQPVETGLQAYQRIVLTFDGAIPSQGDPLTLHLEPIALTDPFLNVPPAAYELSFAWPAGDAVLDDSAAPELVAVRVAAGELAIELSELLDPATAGAILLDGSPLTWTTTADGYTLTSDSPLTAGSYTLDLGTGLEDLAGTALASASSFPFTLVADHLDQTVYTRPDPHEVASSTIGNRFAFHGRPVDEETGLVYVRNRYFDPQTARWLTPDPLGFVDGPSPWAAFRNSPINYTDPLGLDAIAIAFTDFLITVEDRRLPFLGHAAVITINDDGSTKYFEFGRYNGVEQGLTLNPGIKNVAIGPNGLPTRESLKEMLRSVSESRGQNSRVKAAYFVTDQEDTAKMREHGETCVKSNRDPNREPYRIWSNNCGTFAEDVIEAGGVNLPFIIDPRPNARVYAWQEKADFKIEYDPETDALEVEESLFTADKDEILAWKALPLWKRIFTSKPH